MANTNDFLPFAIGAGANVESQADYAASSARATGFQAGVASSAQVNKSARQSAVMAAIIGQFINDIGGLDALDDGELEDLQTNFERAIQNGKLNYGIAGGTANALTTILTPAPATYSPGMVVNLTIAATNSAAATLNVNGLGVKSITNSGAALAGGELVAGSVVSFIYDGTNFQIVGAPRSGRLLRTTVYTLVAGVQYVQVDGGAPTTTGATSFTSHPQASYSFVEGTSAGSAGGGAAATGAGQYSFGSGGNPGAYGLVYIPGKLSSIAVSLGAPGAGVSGAAGGSAASTTFGALITFPGSAGGPASAALTAAAVGSQGTASGAVTVSGAASILKNVFGGGPAFAGFALPASGVAMQGVGGSSIYGQNAFASASGFGNGGGGKANPPSTAAQAGGSGGAPLIVVTEYA